MTGFKNFILRGNLIDLAVAFIIGSAFAAVVTAFTEMLLSAIARVLGGNQPDFTEWRPGDIAVGTFVTALIAFLLLAAVVYFFVVTPYVAAKERFFPSPEPGTPEDVRLLQEIRDLLATRPPV
jgi:large conductance mechanosensitive channel